jgi:hypothetical protein
MQPGCVRLQGLGCSRRLTANEVQLLYIMIAPICESSLGQTWMYVQRMTYTPAGIYLKGCTLGLCSFRRHVPHR